MPCQRVSRGETHDSAHADDMMIYLKTRTHTHNHFQGKSAFDNIRKTPTITIIRSESAACAHITQEYSGNNATKRMNKYK